MSAIVEMVWQTPAGLRAVVVTTDMGHKCGYVGVPVGRPFHGKHYDDVDVEVHGGLTWSDAGGEEGYPVAGTEWWLGYDCAHAGDYVPRLGRIQGDDVYRDLDFCIRECESLARQIVEKTTVSTTPPETLAALRDGTYRQKDSQPISGESSADGNAS